MPVLDAAFVLQATGADARGECPVLPFTGVSTDSRSLQPGELFVALSGPNFDGHDFLDRAFEAGAAAALVLRDAQPPSGNGHCLLEVEDTLTALGQLAAAWRREHSALVAAVTGSNGKTTTKEMLAAILGQRHRVLATRGNLNNLIGLPLTLLRLREVHSACVVEMGMNAPGEIARLTEIAAPEAGVITNVGPAHIGMLGSLEAIAAAKGELFDGLSPAATAVVNLDDPFLAPYAASLPWRVVSFGIDSMAEVRAGEIKAAGGGQTFVLDLAGETLRVRLAAPGRHNVMNALAAAATAWSLGQGADAVAAGLESFTPVAGRLALAGAPGGPAVVDDTYNANPASVACGLSAAVSLAQGRPLVLILGDMKELGDYAAELHRQTGLLAAQAGCRLVVALGRHAEQVAQGAREGGMSPEQTLIFAVMDELLEEITQLLDTRDLVLVKGSRSMAMERVVARIGGGQGGAH
ncbi:MAG: UDP-N-acetylmuramoyl-tripeptide--D-alanyl-D-alanine ligase [Proteobacteria bacterium]|nr:UDP-N-acetylmuramoyl-tripeptide--D-alanyl-D-alanine ligase [Pseudomonadota bacterium]MBU1452950.1 UDP-N-acetylmuramoyl-tripeptide--D-alanyl-D-alanine ligase [Pseudomonadota bacterium]MBU2470107.1 UDP-N-acetylmuramoyl-tripeptide--D-alanyl-D-alanine ligase [Pseudomonadota bacterium]MBU2516214.1 UDP-N-acetylmuramoyl-tripeptide--D-alanyl-D-alanine ligase [Pseudomonadota bacterium]